MIDFFLCPEIHTEAALHYESLLVKKQIEGFFICE